MKTAISVLATLAVAAAFPAHAECPAAVVAAVEKAHAGAKIVTCEHEVKKKKDVYEVDLKTPAGKKLELELDPAGAILESQEQIPSTELPAAVLSALQAKHPDAKIKTAERIIRHGQTSFEIAFVSGGHKFDTTMKEDGAIVEDEAADKAD